MRHTTAAGELAVLLAAALAASGCGENRAPQDAGTLESIPEDRRLVLFTSHKPEVYQPIVEEFENRYEIFVDVESGGTTELMEDIRNFGIGNADVMFGGGEESYDACRDCYLSYETSDADSLDVNVLRDDAVWTPFSELPLVIICNTRLVQEEDAPQGFADLLEDETWKGQIAFADPNHSGTSVTILSALPQILDREPDACIRMLAEQVDGSVLAGSGDVVDSVENGTKQVGITLEETALRRIAQGAHIGIVYPKEGTCVVPDAAAIIKDAPHMDNARTFLDFSVSRDIQQLLQDTMYRRSVRSDTDPVDWEVEIRTVPFDLDWASAHQEEFIRLWEEDTGSESSAEDG